MIEADNLGKERMHLVFPHAPMGINRATIDRIKRACVPNNSATQSHADVESHEVSLAILEKLLFQ